MNPNPYSPPQVPPLPSGPTPGFGPPPGSEQFAPCPQCRCPYAKRIKWTFWGGMLGPKLFTHVKCVNCGSAYNGKTGNWNTNAITIYLVVSVVIGLILGGLIFILPLLM